MCVRIIKESAVKKFACKFPRAAGWLSVWMKAVRAARWTSLVELRAVYPAAGAVTVKSKRTVIVFNVCGNKYRFIAAMHFNTGKAHAPRFLTHAEYSRDKWKNEL